MAPRSPPPREPSPALAASDRYDGQPAGSPETQIRLNCAASASREDWDNANLAIQTAGCVVENSSFPGIPPAVSVFGGPERGICALSSQTGITGLRVAWVNRALIGAGWGYRVGDVSLVLGGVVAGRGVGGQSGQVTGGGLGPR
jgi:hypothetical protein